MFVASIQLYIMLLNCRMIMWTSEELGIIGARQYIQRHAADNDNLQFVMESDLGTFMPLGLEVTGDEFVQCILERIMRLVSRHHCRVYSLLIGIRISFFFYCK